ncbi:MAG: ribokinase [Cereibacter sphaeroides]|uniref:Ribokinase n=1 Tax=Cereibacter sphaeroides TaxID=1063 RepID=A0A2W5SEF1_CERSP|nr:MAG: ribokinase [Cereibacter sphaeroides]
MAVWTFGSINIDHVYRVPHLPRAGETLAAHEYSMGLGGKGANQSVAAARAGARAVHIGAVGPEGRWARDMLDDYGVDIAHVAIAEMPSGHAIINVDPAAENAIVIFSGANHSFTAETVGEALAFAHPGDTLLLQNETSAQADAARIGKEMGLRVIYSAAPFLVSSVKAVLPHVSMLVMNEGEAAELRAAFGQMPEIDMIVTRGGDGAEWLSPGRQTIRVPAFRVTPVDTTGAGDCFTGTLAAALDAGLEPAAAMRRASAAAAIQVTRPGAAQAMPSVDEVDAFLARNPT